MEGGLAVLLLMAALYSPCSGEVTMAVLTKPELEGDTLRIRCSESVVSGAELTSLGVFTDDKQDPGSKLVLVVSYTYKRTISDFEQEWGSTIDRNRANATTTLSGTNANSGNVDFTMSDLRCADSAEFLCQSVTNQDPYTFRTRPQNITVQGVTQYLQLDAPPGSECDVTIDADCSRCVSFDDTTTEKPKYARMHEEIILRCTGLIGKPITENMNPFSWYKRTKMDDFQQPIGSENVTFQATGADSPSSCTRQMTSELRYYPTNTDEELRIFCDVQKTGQSSTISTNISICVSGLIPNPNIPSGPGNPGPSSAGLGGGPIAGIVIGVIALIVLVVVLVYFLWYKRRDSGESYNTREADGRNAPPPVSKKPEMHENTMYDTTGDSHQQDNYPNNRYAPGKVNYSMDNDYYRDDNDTAPRSRDPIGSSV